MATTIADIKMASTVLTSTSAQYRITKTRLTLLHKTPKKNNNKKTPQKNQTKYKTIALKTLDIKQQRTVILERPKNEWVLQFPQLLLPGEKFQAID